MSDTVIKSLEKTIKKLSLKIAREENIDPATLSSLARLVNALTSQEQNKRDPYEYGIHNI